MIGEIGITAGFHQFQGQQEREAARLQSSNEASLPGRAGVSPRQTGTQPTTVGMRPSPNWDGDVESHLSNPAKEATKPPRLSKGEFLCPCGAGIPARENPSTYPVFSRLLLCCSSCLDSMMARAKAARTRTRMSAPHRMGDGRVATQRGARCVGEWKDASLSY